MRKLSIRAQAKQLAGRVRLHELDIESTELESVVLNARRGYVSCISSLMIADFRAYAADRQLLVHMKRKFAYLDIDVGTHKALQHLAELLEFCDAREIQCEINQFVQLSRLTADKMFDPSVRGLQAVRRYALAYEPNASTAAQIVEVPSRADQIFKLLERYLGIDNRYKVRALLVQMQRAAECKNSADSVLRELGVM